MQVQVNSKTVFAFNLGIGTNPDGVHPDWTLMDNGDSYTVKTLQVWVK
jgi:hypothetical protein